MSAPMTRRQENALKTRDALIEAGIACIVERGYDATSLSQIAAAARVSKGAIYHHFPDKRSLFIAAFAAAKQRAVNNVEAAIAEVEKQQPEDPVAAALDASIEVILGDHEYPVLRQQASAILSFAERQSLENTYSLPMVQATLVRLGESQDVSGLDVSAAAELFTAMFDAATEDIAESSDPKLRYTQLRPPLLAATKALINLKN